MRRFVLSIWCHKYAINRYSHLRGLPNIWINHVTEYLIYWLITNSKVLGLCLSDELFSHIFGMRGSRKFCQRDPTPTMFLVDWERNPFTQYRSSEDTSKTSDSLLATVQCPRIYCHLLSFLAAGGHFYIEFWYHRACPCQSFGTTLFPFNWTIIIVLTFGFQTQA